MSSILKMIIEVNEEVPVKDLHALLAFISSRQHANNPRVFFYKDGTSIVVYGKEENIVELFEDLEPFDATIRDISVKLKTVQGSYIDYPEAGE